jgi:hypothetical protein
MGITNAGWGICGFTSSFYAMYHMNPAARPMLINAPSPFSVLIEIKDYLEMLYAAKEVSLLDEIERFTRSFGMVDGFDFSTFTPRSYILYINASYSKYINRTGDVDMSIMGDPKFSIALPPQAVSDYLRRVWKYKSEVHTFNTSADGIIGVKPTKGVVNATMYNGLVHYVYRKNLRYYSWGFSFGQLSEHDFALAYEITLSPS